MREIKFRGKCAFSGVWRYGYFYISKGNFIIRDSEDKESIVLKDSIGQFTGLPDKNGVEIYENDLGLFNKHLCKIVYRKNYCDYVFETLKYKSRLLNITKANITKSNFEIIDNIHENPELL
jgi:hypothetical protein